ncbi:hypothetical protein [Tissierella sp.]|uniref:hypothetical protein n=1 Tax=Tissierella sp. TaxID=41274 RepID=UPI002854B0BA|nr:hypothetical protein [Tissierella sp.]MDR7855823.1 hypothetical protein [Tissierella sp.]
MKGIGEKRILRDGLVGYIQRIIIAVILTLIVAFILNQFVQIEYSRLLEYTALGVAGIGALSVLGGTSTTYNGAYAYHKSQTGMTGTTKNDIKLLQGSYAFCIFMGITAVIVYIISLLL